MIRKYALIAAVVMLTACSSSSENDNSSMDDNSDNEPSPVSDPNGTADEDGTSTDTSPGDSEGDTPTTGNPPSGDPGSETPVTSDSAGSDDPGSPPEQTQNAELYPASISPEDTALLIPAPDSSADLLPDNAQILGDVNGDGIQDISVLGQSAGDSVDFAAVLFGTTSGDYPSIDSLNGNNGFIVDNVLDVSGDNDMKYGIWSAGDINGDGYADIIFANSGFYELSGKRVLPGAVSFPSRRSSLDFTDSELLVRVTIDQNVKVTPAGDINNDGFEDLLLDLNSHAIVYGASDINAIVSDIDQLDIFIDYCQNCTSTAINDFDADGFDDILFRLYGCGSSRGSGAYVSILYGSNDGIAANANSSLDEYSEDEQTRIVTESGSECDAHAGSLAEVGDVDGDGASDLLFRDYVDGGKLVFGTTDARVRTVSLDELDGAKGVQLSGFEESDGSWVFLQDRNKDGYDDIVFADGRMFQGRPRDTQSIDGPVVRRADTSLSVFWAASESSDAAGYRISINDSLVVEVDKGVTETVIEDPVNGEAATLVLEAMGEDGNVLWRKTRRVPAYADPAVNLSATVRAPRLVELTVERIYGDRFLVWRNGVLIGRSIGGGASIYTDDTVESGQTYTYAVTPDYLLNDTLDPELLQRSPLLQQQSNVVEVQTPDS